MNATFQAAAAAATTAASCRLPTAAAGTCDAAPDSATTMCKNKALKTITAGDESSSLRGSSSNLERRGGLPVASSSNL